MRETTTVPLSRVVCRVEGSAGKPGAASHERLGVVLAQQVLADACTADAKALCKCLGYLQPTGADPHAVKCLRALCTQVLEQVRTKTGNKAPYKGG